jgi:hypothetical protein
LARPELWSRAVEGYGGVGMLPWLEWVFPETLLARGRAALVDALRSAADALHAFANAVDDVAGLPPNGGCAADADDAPPLPGADTRERIGEALQRARSHYDAIGDRSAPRRRRR